jgi:hypothetical protein
MWKNIFNSKISFCLRKSLSTKSQNLNNAATIENNILNILKSKYGVGYISNFFSVDPLDLNFTKLK